MPAMVFFMLIYDDPYLSAKSQEIKPHSSVAVVGSTIAPDGSGRWVAVHLNISEEDAQLPSPANKLGRLNTFIQGGWLPAADAEILIKSARHVEHIN